MMYRKVALFSLLFIFLLSTGVLAVDPTPAEPSYCGDGKTISPEQCDDGGFVAQ